MTCKNISLFYKNYKKKFIFIEINFKLIFNNYFIRKSDNMEFIIHKEYKTNVNDLVFKWFDDSFPRFIDRDIITEDSDYDILLKNTKRCFIELLYKKLQVIKKNGLKLDNIKIISLACFSLAIKHILGYDWLYDEYNIINMMTRDSNDRKKVCAMEFELFCILLNLKCISRINKKM